MHIAVLGATGRTGRQLVAQALARGHTATALVRTPAALDTPPSATLRVVTADVTVPETIEAALTDVDAVVSGLGHTPGGPPDLLTTAARAVTAVTGGPSGPHLVWLGAWGTGPSATTAGPLVRGVLRLGLHAEIDDKVVADQLVLDRGGTVFHAGPLTNAALTPRRGVRALSEVRRSLLVRPVSRAAVAAGMLDEAEHPRHRGHVIVPHS